MHTYLQLKLLLLLSFTRLTVAGPLKTEKLNTPVKLSTYACENAVYGYLFLYTASTDPDIYYDAMCNYPPALGSFLLCISKYSDPYSKTFNSTIKFATSYCYEYGGTNKTTTSEDFFLQYENATQYVIDPSSYNLTDTYFTSPVAITKEENAVYYKYLQDIYYQWDTPNLFAAIFYFYFVLVFIIQGSMNYFKRLGLSDPFINNKIMRWYKGHVSTPAIFNGSHFSPLTAFKIFSTLLPTRVETLVVFGFICLNIILTCVDYHVDVYTGDTHLSLLTELISDRTGILSFGLIPLLILFSGRNNMLIQITGIPYSSFIVYHKWVSRFMFIHAMIHSACWTAYAILEDSLAVYYIDGYWRWGVFATCASGIMLFQAFHVFRSLSYETFLIIHIIFASVFMVGCFYHCYDLGYLEWLYASWALWIADRLIRVFRICMFGSKVAQLELLEDDIFRVSVDIGTFDAFPGSYAFVYFMTPFGFWQAHPFTLLKSCVNPEKLMFTIKAKKGMTGYLKKKLAKSSTGKIEIRIGVEGPYGHRAPLEKYTDVLLIAGGSALPGLLAHALDLSSRESIQKQSVKLVWVTRNMLDFQNFSDEVAALASRNKVIVSVYITSGSNKAIEGISEKSSGDEALNLANTSDDVSAKEKTEKQLTPEMFPQIMFNQGRPVIDMLINDSITQQTSSLAIMTCGPPKMCDEAREVTSKAILSTDKVVDLFEELQVW